MNGADNSASETTLVLNEILLQKIENEIEKRKIYNYKIDISAGTEKGDNYLGVIANVCVNGTDENGKKIALNWLAKVAPRAEALRQLLDMQLVYDREIYVYEELFPFFTKFQQEKSVLSPFNCYPQYIFSHMEKYNESFLMENMKSIGYVMKDRKKPLDHNHVKLVMEAYGKLHALSFALKDQQPEEFEKIAEQTTEQIFTATPNKELEKQQAKMFYDRVVGSLDPDDDADAIETFKKYYTKCTEIFLNTLKYPNKYAVIGHGDSWINNMLFKYEDSNHPQRPTKVCVLDWQLAKFGSPAFDLSYFIFTCTDKDLRDTYYDQMIKFYYYSLCKHLVDLGSDPEKLFPFTALQAELKRCCIYGFHMCVMVIHLMVSEVEEIPDWHSSKDAQELIDGITYKLGNQKFYDERLRGVVLDFVKNGYLDF